MKIKPSPALGALLVLGFAGLCGACFRADKPAAEIEALEDLELPVRRAIEAALAAAAERPQDGAAWGRLAMLCHAHGLHPEARRYYLRAEVLAPREPRWPHLRGLACQSLTLIDEARVAFSRALELDAGDVPALCYLGRIEHVEGLDAAARDFYLKALALEPDNIASHLGIGQLDLKRGDEESAIKHLERALALEPRCGQAHSSLAQLHALRGDLKAAEFHRRWSQVSPTKTPLFDPLMEEIFELGLSYTARLDRGRRAGSQGRWREAVENLSASKALQPRLAEPAYFLGLAHLRLGDEKAGLAELEGVTRLEDTSRRVDAWLRISEHYARRGEARQAAAALESVAGAGPPDARIHLARGRLLQAGGETEPALAELDRALELPDPPVEALIEKARILLARRRGSEAVPARPEELRKERERAAAALEACNRALELKADLAEAYEGAAKAHLRLGELALDEAEKAARIDAADEMFVVLRRYFPARGK